MDAERNWPTADLDDELPPELIAQPPSEQRDRSRLLVVDRATGELHHRVFADLVELMQPGDVLVLNETRVFPARLRGRRAGGGEGQWLEQDCDHYPMSPCDRRRRKADWICGRINEETMAIGF